MFLFNRLLNENHHIYKVSRCRRITFDRAVTKLVAVDTSFNFNRCQPSARFSCLRRKFEEEYLVKSSEEDREFRACLRPQDLVARGSFFPPIEQQEGTHNFSVVFVRKPLCSRPCCCPRKRQKTVPSRRSLPTSMDYSKCCSHAAPSRLLFA